MQDRSLKLLERKLKKNLLGHFYVLKADMSLNKDQKVKALRDWSKEFLGLYFSIYAPQKKSYHFEQHPDIYTFNSLENFNEKSYLMGSEEMKQFFRFIEYRPFEFPHRFVFFPRAEKISVTLGNTLLKTLESPPSHLVFFFLCSEEKKLISTIESRAVFLRTHLGKEKKFPIKCQSLEDFFPEDSLHPSVRSALIKTLRENSSLYSLVEEIKKQPQTKEVILSLLAKYFLSLSSQNFSHYNKFFQELKHFEDGEVYHLPLQERLTSLIDATQEAIKS